MYSLTEVKQEPLIELIDGVQVTSLTQDADFAYIEAKRGDYIHKLQAKIVIPGEWRRD